MKHIFRTLLGLVLVVFVLAGCSNPAGPEFSEIPEDNDKLTKVEFRWAEQDENFENYAPQYFLDLHFDFELDSWIYGLPEGYDFDSYSELIKDTERFKKFSEDAFEKAFGTKYYKEGTVIDLKKWTSKAKRLTKTGEVSGMTTCSYFSTKYINRKEGYDIEDPFDEIVVNNEDIIVYVYFDNEFSK